MSEYALGCLVDGPTRVDFGDVRVGSAASQSFWVRLACHDFAGSGITYPQVEIGSSGDPLSPFGVQRSTTQLGQWTFGFRPQTAGPQSAAFPILSPSASSGYPIVCQPNGARVPVQGTGVE